MRDLRWSFKTPAKMEGGEGDGKSQSIECRGSEFEH